MDKDGYKLIITKDSPIDIVEYKKSVVGSGTYFIPFHSGMYGDELLIETVKELDPACRTQSIIIHRRISTKHTTMIKEIPCESKHCDAVIGFCKSDENKDRIHKNQCNKCKKFFCYNHLTLLRDGRGYSGEAQIKLNLCESCIKNLNPVYE